MNYHCYRKVTWWGGYVTTITYKGCLEDCGKNQIVWFLATYYHSAIKVHFPGYFFGMCSILGFIYWPYRCWSHASLVVFSDFSFHKFTFDTLKTPNKLKHKGNSFRHYSIWSSGSISMLSLMELLLPEPWFLSDSTISLPESLCSAVRMKSFSFIAAGKWFYTLF